MENSTFPYSYHTFLFPFIWNKNSTLKLFQFVKLLNKSWVPDQTSFYDINKISDSDFYASAQYFKKDAINVLLTPEQDSIKKYFFCISDKTNFSRTKNSKPCGKYIISKENVSYELDINQIRLSVLDTGVALISIELEYWGDKIIDGKNIQSRTTDDVNAINEHGRRIRLPYIGTNPCHTLVADKISIKIGEFEIFEDFRNTIENFNILDSEKTLSQSFMMKPISRLLFDNCDLANNTLMVEPIVDDRMYVCCLIADDTLSESFATRDIYKDPEIYKLGFVEKSLSCPTLTMMENILKRCVYDRWGKCGTIDIITHHSFVRLTSSSVVYEVINPFLSLYVKMAELAVIQKSTLIALENECFNCKTKNIQKIQEKYVKAQQMILIDECTIQEQGVEEFEMIRNELGINQRITSLDKRLKELCDLANLISTNAQNWFIGILTVVGTIAAIISILPITKIWNWVLKFF